MKKVYNIINDRAYNIIDDSGFINNINDNGL